MKTDEELKRDINKLIETFSTNQLLFIHSYLKQFSMLKTQGR